MQDLFLVKLGGSLITDKAKPYTAKLSIIKRLVKEISDVKKDKEIKIIIGNGGGSFPHTSAKKYQTQNGIINKESYFGMSVVQNDAAKLNRIIIDEFLKIKTKAISIQASCCCVAENSKIKKMFLQPIESLLDYNIIPVVYGDIGIDLKKKMLYSIYRRNSLFFS